LLQSFFEDSILFVVLMKNFIIFENIDIYNYSGKLLLRMPKSLHANLSAGARLEGVSHNQYILYKLTGNSKKAS